MSDALRPADSVYPRASWLPGNASQQGAYSVALGAALWGLFWIPLRYLDNIGVSGLWAVALVMSTLVIPSVMVLYKLKKLHTLKSRNAWIVGAAIGTSTVLYFTGVLFSDVIRVVFLFYLLPIWTTISARIIYKEPITRSRLLIIGLALLGLWLLLGGGSAIPIPSNIGDWCGLLAGIFWGVCLSLIRGNDDVDAHAMVCATAISATIVSTIIALVLMQLGFAEAPKTDSWILVIGAALALSVFFLFPSFISQVWGAQRIAAPTAALLTMSEILVATLSAYILVGTTLNSAALFGALVILIAVLIDIALKFKQA